MTTLHDRDSDVHIKHKGKAGSAHAILTDKAGTPIDSTNPLPVAATVAGTGLTEVTASDGYLLEPDAYAQTFNYNGDGTLNYIQVTAVNTFSYRQSFTYSPPGTLTGISNWVKQ